jgi:hypothetical protein
MATREYQDLVDHLLAYRRKEITLAELEVRERLLLGTFNSWQQKNYFLLRGNYIQVPTTQLPSTQVNMNNPNNKSCGCGCSGECTDSIDWIYIGGIGLLLLFVMRARRV